MVHHPAQLCVLLTIEAKNATEAGRLIQGN